MKTSARKIAARYVKALFSVAGSHVEQVEKDLNLLGEALGMNLEFRDFIHNPLFTREEQTKVLDAALNKMKAHDVTRRFMHTLILKKRLALLPEAISQFCDEAAKARGELKAQMIVPSPLNVRVVDMVAERLGRAYGKKITIEMRQDPALLGGAIVKIGSLQLDSSLAGKLERLKTALKAA